MSTASEEILDRYRKTEVETDTFGRAITVRRLRPSQQISIMRLAESEISTAVNVMTIAAAVSKIDDAVYSFPKSVGELNAVIDVLDQEGLAAAAGAYMRLTGGERSSEAENGMETAKN